VKDVIFGLLWSTGRTTRLYGKAKDEDEERGVIQPSMLGDTFGCKSMKMRIELNH